MSSPEDHIHTAVAAQRASASLVETSNRFLVRIIVAAITALLLVAITILAWGAISFGSQVRTLQTRQIQFHHDTLTNNAALSNLTMALATAEAANKCQGNDLASILNELKESQLAQEHHTAPPTFAFPTPC